MNNDYIEKARTIVGGSEDNDYMLIPKEHAELFVDEIPELALILKSSEIEGVASKYDEYNKEAIKAQNKFKAYSDKARLWVFLTACCSTLVLVVATLFGQTDDSAIAKGLFILFSISVIVFSYLASTRIKLIKNMKLLERWMKNRSNAEMQRLNYFACFLKQKSSNDTTKDPILFNMLQLEFFRRFQLDMQLSYYKNRGKQHGSIADQAIAISTWAIGGAGLTAGIAGFLGATFNPKWAVIAGFAFVCQAFASNVLNKEAVNQNRRNEERFGRTREILQNLKMRLDHVRNQIINGNKKVLLKFVEAVHEQLSLEHRQWTDDISNVSKAILELEEQLKGFENDSKPKKSNAG